MSEPDLSFIAEQLARVLAELRTLPAMRDELRLLRQEFQLMREQMRIQGAAIDRLDDTIRMNVLDRLSALEQK